MSGQSQIGQALRSDRSSVGLAERIVTLLLEHDPQLLRVTGLTLNLPWGPVPLSLAYSTGRSLSYIRYCLDRWSEGESRYLLRLVGLSGFPPSRKRLRFLAEALDQEVRTQIENRLIGKTLPAEVSTRRLSADPHHP